MKLLLIAGLIFYGAALFALGAFYGRRWEQAAMAEIVKTERWGIDTLVAVRRRVARFLSSPEVPPHA